MGRELAAFGRKADPQHRRFHFGLEMSEFGRRCYRRPYYARFGALTEPADAHEVQAKSLGLDAHEQRGLMCMLEAQPKSHPVDPRI